MADKYIKVSRIEQVINELVIRSNNTRDDTCLLYTSDAADE